MSDEQSKRPPELGEPGEHPLSVLLFSWMRTALFFQRQVQFATDYIKELAKQQQVANSNASMAKATQQMVDYGKATELSAKQIMRANQILPAQITDIVTSLASGQKPWLVLIQQGGQIKDMYGGIGNAQAAVGDHGQAVVFRMDFVFADFAILQFADQGGGAEGNLVEAILAMHD